MIKEFALYRGDELLIIGTLEEIAEHEGMSVQSVRRIGTKSYRKLTANFSYERSRYLVPIDLEEE